MRAEPTVLKREPGNFDWDLLPTPRLSDRAICLMRITAKKFSFAVHHHLRCIRTLQSESGRVATLPVREGVGGIRIDPSGMIPVVHVLAEHDDLRSRDGLCAVQPLQKSIGRRTT